MPDKRLKPEVIIRKLRKANVLPGQGKTVAEAIKQLFNPNVTYQLSSKEYGGMKVDQAKRLKDPKKESARLKRLLAYTGLNKAILNVVVECLKAPSKQFERKRLRLEDGPSVCGLSTSTTIGLVTLCKLIPLQVFFSIEVSDCNIQFV